MAHTGVSGRSTALTGHLKPISTFQTNRPCVITSTDPSQARPFTGTAREFHALAKRLSSRRVAASPELSALLLFQFLHQIYLFGD
jgi:hypothetical protein